MKKLVLGSLILGAIASLSASALAAYEDTEYFTIARLEASTESSGGYRIYPRDYSLPTGQGCDNTDFAEIRQDLVEDREMMQHTLLAAFMSGRKVKLRLESCGLTRRPAYRIVTLQSTM